MKSSAETGSAGLTRRDMLKASGLAVGGLVVGGTVIGGSPNNAQAEESCPDGTCTCPDGPACNWDQPVDGRRYRYFEQLPAYHPFGNTATTIPKLGENEMRITFMGSCIPTVNRRAQQMMSVFVEVGWDSANQKPLDNFVFDCGAGVITNYNSMNVNFGRMDKIFLNHPHGDHMSDLTHIYCFGVSAGRLSPLYVWGPKDSGVARPDTATYHPGKKYPDGIKTFCEHLREACRWHTESFSFQSTSYGPHANHPLTEQWGLPYQPEPVGDDDPNDGYAMYPIELDWEKGLDEDRVAYKNTDTGVTISFFKVIHCRKGSLGYKLEFTPPNVENPKTLTMIYTSDTKPETYSVEEAKNNGKGIDVFIHEMIVPPRIWAMKFTHGTDPDAVPQTFVDDLAMVQNSSHTPQGAFGYLLSQVEPRPRLTVATHFPVADDTVACAMKSVMEHCNVVQGRDPKPNEDAARITWSFDCMVITVGKDRILEQRGVVNDFEYTPTVPAQSGKNVPIYNDGKGKGDPYAQIDLSTEIPACDCDTGECHYRSDGF